MRILGIDPGYAIVGFGVVDYENTRFKLIDMGAVTTAADMPFEARLKALYLDMSEIIDTYFSSTPTRKRLLTWRRRGA